MKKLLLFGIVFFSLIFGCYADTFVNVSFESDDTNSIINFTKSVNGSSITTTSSQVIINDFQFSDGSNWSDVSGGIVDTLDPLIFDVAGEQIKTENFISYFYFNSPEGLVEDFKYNDLESDGEELRVIFKDIEPEGEKSWLWEKVGYVSDYFNFTYSYDTYNNETFNVEYSDIKVNIFDRITGDVLTGVNVSVSIDGLVSGVTDNGSITFQNTSYPANVYTAKGSATGYFTELKSFTYTGLDDIEVDLYLLDIDYNQSSTLFITVVDSFTHFLPNATVQLEEFDDSIQDWKDIGQCITNSDGECLFLVEVGTKKYRISASKVINGILQTDITSELGEIFQPEISNGQLIYGNEIVRTLTLGSTPELDLPIFDYLTINAPYDTNATIINLNDANYTTEYEGDFSNTLGLEFTVCLEFYTYEFGQEQFLTKDCVSGESGKLPGYTYSLSRDYRNIVKVTAEQGEYYTVFKEYNYLENDSLFYMLNKDNLVPSFILIAWIALLSISLYARNVLIFVIGSFFLAILEFMFFPSFINLGGTVLSILIGWGIFNISRKQEDNL